MDNITSEGGRNIGFENRAMFTHAGKIVTLEGDLRCDILDINKLIINHVPISFKFYPARNNFSLLTPDGDDRYYVDLIDVVLKVEHIIPNPQILTAVEKMLQDRPAEYEFTCSDIRSFSVPAGVYKWEIDTLYPSSEIPDELIVGFVDSEAFQGSTDRNAFNFDHFNLSYISFNIENLPVNAQVYEPNYSELQFTSEYLALFSDSDVNGDIRRDRGVVSWSDFAGGYALYRFKITNGLQKDFVATAKTGQSRLMFKFNESLKRSITAICYGRRAHTLQIDQSRNISIL
jgi:hypothetical protein